jgi:hypothetical protein
MANLTYTEKRGLERLFNMEGGYVLDFSTRRFSEFVFDSIGKRLDDEKYCALGGSKANRLRAFWAVEQDHLVGKLLSDLISYATPSEVSAGDAPLIEACRRTAERLLQSVPVEDIDAISPEDAEKDLKLLGDAIRESLEKNQPQLGLDRLHTFVGKYIRGLCEGRGIAVAREKPLHSLMGEYGKSLRDAGHIHSEMTERILKSSISTLESFNRVRNEHSLAHDNPVLNYDESLLIFSHVMSALKFIQRLELRLSGGRASSNADDAVA